MQVVVLANKKLKEEFLAYTTDSGSNMNLRWIEKPADYSGHYKEAACIDLLFENNKERVQWLNQFTDALIVVNSVIVPVEKINDDFVRINGWNTFLKRPVVEAACNNEVLKKDTENLFSLFGRTVEWVPDITGFITPRIIVSIINEAFIALEEKVSNEKEIDTAMKLGTNYPYGPFEWADQIGHENVYGLLHALEEEQSRYQPSLLLKQKVFAS